MFSDHEMVRRAATEAMCNLVPHKAMMDHLAQPDHLKLWLAFAVDYEDNYECARAAAGCLAMATQDELIAEEFVKLDNFRKHTTTLLESGRLELMHRTFALVHSLVLHGGKIKEKAISEGLVDFCRAYIELQQHAGGDLEFSEQEKQILPVTIDIAKQIIKA
jgi:protein unc-45